MDRPTAINTAVAYLKEALRDGPRLVKDLEMEAKEKKRISLSTLRRGRTAAWRANLS